MINTMEKKSTSWQRNLLLVGVLLVAAAAVAYLIGKSAGEKKNHIISGFAWDAAEWAKRTQGVRTSYNPDHDLDATTLTLTPGDPRWLDFVFWCFDNKVAEHQVEAYGGTEWEGPTGGVIFHWAPGSRWETHTLASFGFTVGHTIGEHRWMDTQFPEFFEQYGGVYGVNVKDRLAELDTASPGGWVKFLEYCGGPNSPYYRYLFHREEVIDTTQDKIYLVAGQGVAFEYSFERYYHEVREVLTDAKAFQFFQQYDMYGPGFASVGGWAKNKLVAGMNGIYLSDDTSKWMTKPGVANAVRYNPNPQPPTLPDHLPDLESVKRGQIVYKAQCVPCHGVSGDGHGFLANGFEVRPRDFRQGLYKFRSTKNGALPTFADVEHTIRVGVPHSTMPAWGEFLTPEQVSDVTKYIVTFSPKFTDAWRSHDVPAVVPIPPLPADLASMVGRGKVLYDTLQCAKCHGDGGHGDGPSAKDLKDEWGFPIKAADLTYKWVFKLGYRPQDVFKSMNTGLNGTPMPSYYGVIATDADRWALISYILSLSPSTRPVLHLADYKQGVLAISKRLDANGRVR